VGSFLNVWKLENINKIQKIAMEQSRHKIPLLMGKDVIHGYRTMFPIPLAQAASFNPELIERGSRIAAI
jgi:beta-glucosidase